MQIGPGPTLLKLKWPPIMQTQQLGGGGAYTPSHHMHINQSINHYTQNHFSPLQRVVASHTFWLKGEWRDRGRSSVTSSNHHHQVDRDLLGRETEAETQTHRLVWLWLFHNNTSGVWACVFRWPLSVWQCVCVRAWRSIQCAPSMFLIGLSTC